MWEFSFKFKFGKVEQVVDSTTPEYYDLSSGQFERSQPMGFALPDDYGVEEDKR